MERAQLFRLSEDLVLHPYMIEMSLDKAYVISCYLTGSRKFELYSPNSKLCIGSMMIMRTVSKYGRRDNSVQRVACFLTKSSRAFDVVRLAYCSPRRRCSASVRARKPGNHAVSFGQDNCAREPYHSLQMPHHSFCPSVLSSIGYKSTCVSANQSRRFCAPQVCRSIHPQVRL